MTVIENARMGLEKANWFFPELGSLKNSGRSNSVLTGGAMTGADSGYEERESAREIEDVIGQGGASSAGEEEEEQRTANADATPGGRGG
jgi:hypothetical protein